jgi:hypothetical protein
LADDSYVLEVTKAISEPRLNRYHNELKTQTPHDIAALELYAWNAKVSAAFLMPLHIVEVVVRNAISYAIASSIDEPNWTSAPSFVYRLPNGQKQLLTKLCSRHDGVDKIIPELKFAFWEAMLTSRHDDRIWKKYFFQVFPNCDHSLSVADNRKLVHDEVAHIRKLRNRIAHYEPVFYRDLNSDYQRMYDIVELCCDKTAQWMHSNQLVLDVLAEQPKRG